MTDLPHPHWAAMERAIRVVPGQTDLLLDADASPRTLLSPWAFWLLIGLVRQRARQDWALGVLRDRLGISVAQMAGSRETYTVPPDEGVVPGLMDWEYQVGTWMFQLTHRITGEFIRAACYEETGQVICGRYLILYLLKQCSPEPPERRLLELHPSIWTLDLAKRELQRAGLLLPFQNQRDAFTFPPQVVDRFDLVSDFCEAWCDDARRPGAAWAVGDWMAAARLNSDPDVQLGALLRAQPCRRRRARMLLKRLESKTWGGRALTALEEVGPPYADGALAAAFLGRRLDLAETALELIDGRDDPSWCPHVRRLFQRLDPNRSRAQMRCWRLCAEILLRHGVEKAGVLKRLGQARRFQVAEVALMALRYDPARAAPLFLRALRSIDSDDRTNAAAILGILDEGWSRRLMLEILNESDNVAATAECRSALAFSGDPAARLAAQQWERRHQGGPELQSRDFFVATLRDAIDGAMAAMMDQFNDVVLPLRGRIT